MPSRAISENTANATMSAATMVEPTGVSIRMDTKMPVSAHSTDSAAEQIVTPLKLLNTRIAEQGPVRIRLRNVPPERTALVWNEMRRDPVELVVEKAGNELFATIPIIGTWNGGYLCFKS